jgi:hypothetical protein
MTPLTFIYTVIYVGPLLALLAVIYANKQDRRNPIDKAPTTPLALPAALVLVVWLTSAVLSADVPGQDPCSLLEPYSWQWWLLGCYWGSYPG